MKNMLALTVIIMTLCKLTEARPWDRRLLDLERRSSAQSDEILKMLDGLENTAKSEIESTINKMTTLTHYAEKLMGEAKENFESTLKTIEELRQLVEDVPALETFEESTENVSEQDIVAAEDEQEESVDEGYLEEELLLDEIPSEPEVILPEEEAEEEEAEEEAAEEGDQKVDGAQDVIKQLNQLIDIEEHMDEMDREQSTEEMAVETMIEEEIARYYEASAQLEEPEINEEDAADAYMKELGFL